MPNLRITNVNWQRICPRDIQVWLTVSRDDGDVITHFSGVQFPDRTGYVHWTIMGPGFPPNGSYDQTDQAVYVTNQSQVTFTKRIPNVSPGEYTLTATLNITDGPQGQSFGDCGVGAGQSGLSVTNDRPVLVMGAAVTGADQSAVYVTLNGNVTDECPAYCTTAVSAYIVGVDDYDLEVGSRYDIGTRNWPDASYTAIWPLTSTEFGMIANNPDITGARVVFTGITTDQFGVQSWPQTARVRIDKPAGKNFIGNE